jgi:hypothetical protein
MQKPPDTAENRFYEVTNSKSTTELVELLGSDCKITSQLITIGECYTTPEYFPECYVTGKTNADTILRRHRIFAAGDGWRIKYNRTRYYTISVQNDSSDVDEWRFIVRKFTTAAHIDATETEEWIYVANSRIPGAGRGVFARRNIPQNTIFGYYRGEILDYYKDRNRKSDKVMSLYKRPAWWPAGVKFYKGISVDGDVGGSWLALINDYRGTSRKKNVDFDQDGLMYTVVDIKADEELLLDYGDGYWRGRTHFDGSKESMEDSLT